MPALPSLAVLIFAESAVADPDSSSAADPGVSSFRRGVHCEI